MRLLISLVALFYLSNSFALNCSMYKKDLRKISSKKNCQGKQVHLTFDDGPNLKTTPKIVAALEKQKVSGTFLVSTHELEHKSKKDLAAKAKLMQRMLKNGFSIGSHGHDHNAYDLRYTSGGKLLSKGYNNGEKRSQIKKSVDLLNKFTNGGFKKQKHKVIRFPYGRGVSPSDFELRQMRRDGRYIKDGTYAQKLDYYREHSPAMQAASDFGLSHLGWSHDSHDSTSAGVPANKNNYIDSALESLCAGRKKTKIALFHDVRPVNSTPSKYSTASRPMTVMEEIIEKAKCMKVQFVSLDQLLEKKLGLGEYVPSYTAKKHIRDIATVLHKPAKIDPLDILKNYQICATGKVYKSEERSCFSKYAGKSFDHCQGESSFCIDGQWITNRSVRNLICNNIIDSESGVELARNVIGKGCHSASKKSEASIPGKVSCYCQYKDNSEDLVWKCYDVSSPHKSKQL